MSTESVGFGELGELAADEHGERVQCHLCGGWFAALGTHVARGHKLSPDDYRAQFELRATTGLVSPALRHKLAVRARTELEPFRALGAAFLRTLTAEERSSMVAGRTWRLESRRDPANQERWAAQAWARSEAYRSGHRIPRPPSNPHERGRRGGQRLQELRRDPAYERVYREHLARGGWVTARCLVCGEAFKVRAGWIRRGFGRFCGAACRGVVYRSPDRSAKLSAARRRTGRPSREQLNALAEDRFAALPAEVARLVREYYGLNGSAPKTNRELASETGLSRRRVAALIKEGVVRLLRHDDPIAAQA